MKKLRFLSFYQSTSVNPDSSELLRKKTASYNQLPKHRPSWSDWLTSLFSSLLITDQTDQEIFEMT